MRYLKREPCADGCGRNASVFNSDNLCMTCYYGKHPDEMSRAQPMKFREHVVMGFLDRSLQLLELPQDASVRFDRRVPDAPGCLRRPDLLLLMKTHSVIVEVRYLHYFTCSHAMLLESNM